MEEKTQEIANFKLYPQRHSRIGNFSEMPVWVFLVGNYMDKFSYEMFFEKLTGILDMIVYVLDTNPGENFKTLKGFLDQVPLIPQQIAQYYDIVQTSNLYYLGGHHLGATIALNAVYPSNSQSSLHSITMRPIELPLNGFICLFPIDGFSTHSADYSDQLKYSAEKDTRYVTCHGQSNPYPILMVCSNHNDQESTGVRIFNAISSSYNFPQNKYCFVSKGTYHSLCVPDPPQLTSTRQHRLLDQNSKGFRPSPISSTVHDPVEEEKRKRFHKFLLDKIASFLFEEEMDLMNVDDLHLSRNHLLLVEKP